MIQYKNRRKTLVNTYFGNSYHTYICFCCALWRINISNFVISLVINRCHRNELMHRQAVTSDIYIHFCLWLEVSNKWKTNVTYKGASSDVERNSLSVVFTP